MLHIISGPPCAGKSTYVKENAKPGELRIDYDLIALALGAKSSHAAEGHVKQAAFNAREGAIKTALNNPDAESWIIHTSPSEDHMKLYEEVGAEFIRLDPGYETCMERAKQDGRPQQTIDAIEKWYSGKKGEKMKNRKIKTYEVKADSGAISGYASTWTREPDSYGDIVAKGAFAESIAQIKAEGRVLPLLFNHDNYNIRHFIGGVTNFEEDEHGLKFDATFDDTEEGQRARQLAMDGRLAKFSFAYDVLDQGTVTLEDGREANELRKVNIHEVSLVLYPANPDTSVISVKSGRRNSAKDEEELKKLKELAQEILSVVDGLMADGIDEPQGGDSGAKSEDPDTDNDEERKRKAMLLKEAEKLIKNMEEHK